MASSLETYNTRTLQPLESYSLGIRLGSLTWGDSACSGGDWGDDGLLYVTGHDAAQLHVLRLPKQGVTLEYVTTIDVPIEGQSWAWDRSAERVIYGISRARQEVIAARIPVVPETL